MPRITKDDWKAWDEEKKRFAERETEGYCLDLPQPASNESGQY
ncbi:hypothetical protein ES705_12493 [subsurface metagenome]